MKRCKSDGLSKKSDGGRQKNMWVALTRCQVRMTFNPLSRKTLTSNCFVPIQLRTVPALLHWNNTQVQELEDRNLKC